MKEKERQKVRFLWVLLMLYICALMHKMFANLKSTLFATLKYKCILSIPRFRKVRDKISLSSNFDCLPSHGCRRLYCGSKNYITDKIAGNMVYITH